MTENDKFNLGRFLDYAEEQLRGSPVQIRRDLIEKEANMAAEPKDVANTDTTPPTKRTAKERAARGDGIHDDAPALQSAIDEAARNAELDKALMSIWRAPSIVNIEAQSSRIRDLFAQYRAALQRANDELIEWDNAHKNCVPLAEVREMLIEAASRGQRGLHGKYSDPDDRRARIADAILREHGYGGEP